MSDTLVANREFKDCRLLITSWGVGGRTLAVFYSTPDGKEMKTIHHFEFDDDGELVKAYKRPFNYDICYEPLEVFVDRKKPPKPREPGEPRFIISEGSTGEWSKDLIVRKA